MKITHVLERTCDGLDRLYKHMIKSNNAIWVVLWLFCFRYAPSMFPQKTGPLLAHDIVSMLPKCQPLMFTKHDQL